MALWTQDSTCFYWKDTGHTKDNCIQLNCKLAGELQMTKGIVAQLGKWHYWHSTKLNTPLPLNQGKGEVENGPSHT